MSRADLIKERATKLADVLRQKRDTSEYPLDASRLRELADPTLSDEDLFKALADESLIAAARKDLSAPVALAEDAATFAASDRLLEYALGKLASADKPLHPVARIVAKVDKALQPAFEAALNERLAANNLPAGVGRQDVKDTPHLFLEQFPPPPPKRFPARELAEQLAAALAARQQQGQPVAVLEQLCPADTPPNVLKKALSEEAFATKAVVLPVSKTLTLAAPVSEQQALLSSDQLLTALLEARTTAKKPFIIPADLTAALPEPHHEAFSRLLAERLGANRLPAGVKVRDEEGQSVLCLESNLPISLLLGEKVLAGLGRRRDGEDYPVRLNALVAADTPNTPPEQIEQLASDKTFRGKIVAAVPGRADSPVALPGDEERLATSPLCLQSAVEQLSTREQPLQPLKKIVARLDAALRPAFEQAVAKHLEQKTLPASLAAHDIKGQVHLRRADYPLPPPADEALATRLLAALKNARQSNNYPLPFRTLVQQTDDSASDKLSRAALAHNAFRAHATPAVPGDLDSLVALNEDRARLLNDPRLLESVLSRVRTPDNQAIPVADLGKPLSADLRPDFTTAVIAQLESGNQPATVGCLMIKKKPFVFLKSDLNTPPVIPPAPAEEVPVRETFEAEMTRLEEGRDQREDKPAAEQGELFEPATKSN